ncbi:ferrous iron transport protein B [Methanosphaerula subterraneus]|jgi:ferrous iron transport protein B|uniref:ferrous iron transport protein B n=1 Tax=Methanosphaerula subterraneus TaxID=3350244 RepID=UPI003F839F7B
MKAALIGNPGVGKSLIFMQLTGLGVEVGNMPGSSIELMSGTVCVNRDQKEWLDLVDMPGLYSLDGQGEKEVLVRRVLEEPEVDALIVVLDATRFERNLYLLLQIAEYRIPMIVVVNLTDEAIKEGVSIDPDALSALLGVPVIRAAAALGTGIDQIVPAVMRSAKVSAIEVPYDHQIEAALRSFQKTMGIGRRVGLQAMQGISPDPEMLEVTAMVAEEIENRHRMSVNQIIATNRHNYAHTLAGQVLSTGAHHNRFDLDRILTRQFPGIPILIGVILSMLLIVFAVGSRLEDLIVWGFTTYLMTPIQALPLSPLVEQLAYSVVLALESGFGIAFPYIFTFYILLSVLEDSGYMTRAAFLADRAMHRLGMHGEAIIPLVLGFGCNVPAVMGTRLLSSRRERIIAAFLITMVPCSARTVVISGIVAKFVGVLPALSIYLIVLVLILLTGVILSRVTPGPQYGMILEMTPLRRPKAGMVLRKSWMRIQEFLVIAMPLLLISSVILGLLGFYGVIAAFQQAAVPISEGLLGLPSYASTALLFGILRKEMAFETLAVLAGTTDLITVMTRTQLYVFALVSTLFVPCISTIAVLNRELGVKVAALITAYTVLLGLGIGALIHLLMA